MNVFTRTTATAMLPALMCMDRTIACVIQDIQETARTAPTLMSVQLTLITAMLMPRAATMMEVLRAPVTQAIKEMALTVRM